MRKYLFGFACFLFMGLIITAGPTVQVTPAGAAIQHQGTSSFTQDDDSAAGSITWNHTVTAGADRVLIVTTAIDSKSGAVISEVTFDGNLLTRRTAKNQNFDEEVQLWFLLDPPVGTYPVTVDYTASFFGFEARASTYTGVSQNRPISAVAAAGGSGSAATVTIASATGELVIDTLGYNNIGTMTADAPQNERFNLSSAWNGTAGSEKAGASSVTMSWNLQNAGTWSLVAASLRPAQKPVVRTVTVKPSGGDYHSLNDALEGEAADLVALNRQLNIELYAMTDTELVDLVSPAYTTDPDHFIKVYTPVSQRHAGQWDSGKYNLDTVAQIIAGGGTYPACIHIGEVDLWLDGIQALCSYPGTNFPSMIAAGPGPAGAGTLRISNSIFKGHWTGSSVSENANFIITYDWPATSEMWVWNTIATDFWWTDNSRGRGLHTTGMQGGEIWWSNVTLANLANAVSLDSATRMHVRNSLAQLPAGGSSWPINAWADQSDSDYNASNQNEVLAGANSLPGSTFMFQGMDDWRLAASDTGAMNLGVNSYNSYYINDGKDIAGNVRDTVWDIGASEYVDPATIIIMTAASPAGGVYTSAQSVSLTSNVPATIYYTTDGSTPTNSSAVYSGAISIATTTTLQYFAADAVGNSEAVQTQVYTIQTPPQPTPTGGGSGGGSSGGCFITSAMGW